MHRARLEQGGRTRARLVEAAQELLVTHGAEGMSLQRVAAKVGLTVGAVQAHFGSKTGLLLAVLELSQAEAEQRWHDALSRLANSDDWVAELVHVLWELASDELLMARQEVQRAARHDPAVAQRFTELMGADFMSTEQIADALGVRADDDWEMAFAAVASMVDSLAHVRDLLDPAHTQERLERISAWCAPLLRR